MIDVAVIEVHGFFHQPQTQKSDIKIQVQVFTQFLLAAGETGKEILSPVATVIFSGLFSSTLLNLIVTPLVFWRYGKNTALSTIQEQEKDHV
mgnify:CR=1 FL=1